MLRNEVKPIKQLIAATIRQNIAVKPKASAYTLRSTVAANLSRLMEQFPDKYNAKALAPHAVWPYGSSKAGKKISERAIQYVLEPTSPGAPSATLDIVTALANAFEVPPWRLLVTDEEIRAWVIEHFGGARLGTAEPDPLGPEARWRVGTADASARSGAVHSTRKRRLKPKGEK